MFNENILTQIQNFKLQIKTLETQLDTLNIQIQNNGIFNIGTQLNYMGIQILNLGIQMLNIGNQIPNINQINMMDMNKELQNIVTQINNIIYPPMNMPGIEMPPMNMFPMGMPPFDIQMQMDNKIKEKSNIPKMNIIFKTTQEMQIILVFDYGTTIDEILKKYLNEIGRPDLINTDKIFFVYNACQLRFGDKTKIEDYFNHNPPTIIVNELHALRGGKNL